WAGAPIQRVRSATHVATSTGRAPRGGHRRTARIPVVTPVVADGLSPLGMLVADAAIPPRPRGDCDKFNSNRFMALLLSTMARTHPGKRRPVPLSPTSAGAPLRALQLVRLR